MIASAIRRLPMGAPALRAACRSPALRGLGARAIVVGYSRTLKAPEVRTAILGGYQVNVDLAEWTGSAAYFLAEPGVSWTPEHLASKGDVCLDVGANAGLYTNFLAHRTGRDGFTVAFRVTNPQVAARLAASLKANGYEARALVETRAAWDRPGVTLELLISDDPPQFWHIFVRTAAASRRK